MERYSRCRIKVDSEKVKRLAQFNYGSIKELLKDLGYSRQRYLEVVNTPHRSRNEKCLLKLAKCLGTDVVYITYEMSEGR